MKLTVVIDGTTTKVDVPSVEEAQQVYCKMREQSGLGASAFGRGMVRKGTRLVATISYNGRVWDAKGNPVAAEDVCGLDADIFYGKDVA